jgi:DNA-binding HxlR family transcriptional regulator
MPAGRTSTHRAARTNRPLLALLDLLGRRWLLRVIWELREETLTFRALRARCNAMSPSVLNRRLAELRDVGIVDVRSGGGYCLTAEGKSLVHALLPLRRWADRRALQRPRATRAGGRASRRKARKPRAAR